MTGRPRTSTLVISGLFLAVLALYILVRPVPTAAPAGSSQYVGHPAPSASTSSPTRASPSPTRSPSPSHTPSPVPTPTSSSPTSAGSPTAAPSAVSPSPSAGSPTP
jgi:hypothetical protein